MNVIFSTVSRKINFIEAGVDSIRRDVPDQEIYLMAGGTDFKYLENLKKDENIYITDDLHEKEASLEHGIQKGAYGYYRCLTLDRNSPALIIEDDTILKKGWYNELTNYARELRKEHERFIISLIVPFPDCVGEPNIKTQSIQQFKYKAELFPTEPGKAPNVTYVMWCNTSAVYYPASVLQTDLPEFVYKHSVEQDGMYDLAIGNYMYNMAIPIYLFVPEMAKNFGGDEYISAMGEPTLRKHADYSGWTFK